jgi:citrate lyase subunit beta / citryl-CoA lyase
MTDQLLQYARELLSNAPEEATGALPDRVRVSPIRSALYVPGNRRDWLRKCGRFGADAIVIDLEDAVLPPDRPEARKIIGEELPLVSSSVRSVWVRVNSEPEEMAADLEAVVRPGLSAIQLSKVFVPEQVRELELLLGFLEGKNGMKFGTVAICPLLETAGGIRCAYEIAMCSRRVEYMGGMVAPAGDAARALRLNAMSDLVGSESYFLRSKIIVDVRSAGIRFPLGGVVTNLSPDQELLRAFASANRNMGYSGMFVIHPSHVSTVNSIFSPSEKEVRAAQLALSAFQSSVGRGAIRGPGGEMIDLAQARHSAIVLEEAYELGINISQSAG